jgi:phytoene synthase
MSDTTALSYCAQQVRRFDRDRFVAAMFAPTTRREAILGLYALNVEIAQIREQIREPLLGRIRLQWWRDSLEGLRSGKVVAHPIALSLGRAVTQLCLSKAPFEQLLLAREQDLEMTPPDDLQAFLSYAEGTGGTINVLAMEILGVRDPEALAATRAIGIAWALTGLLRAVPFHAAHRRVYLPATLLAEHGLSTEDLLAGRNASGLSQVAKTVASLAQDHLDEAKRLYRKPSRAALPGLLMAPLAEAYLGALVKSRYNLFDQRWSAPRPRPLRLAWKMFLGRI